MATEQKSGWQKLEEAVHEARRNPQEEFDRSRDFMYGLGALSLMRKVQSILPNTTIEVLDDFEKAGGKGSSPMIIIRGPETTEDPTHPLILKRGVTSTKIRRSLRIYPNLGEESVTVNVWRFSTWVHEDNSEEPGIGSNLHHELAYGKSDLPVEILKGVRRLMQIDDALDQRLVDALGLKNPLPPLKPLRRK